MADEKDGGPMTPDKPSQDPIERGREIAREHGPAGAVRLAVKQEGELRAQAEEIAAARKDVELWRRQATTDASEIAALKHSVEVKDRQWGEIKYAYDSAKDNGRWHEERNGEAQAALYEAEARLADEQHSHNLSVVDLVTAKDEAERWRKEFQKETLARSEAVALNAAQAEEIAALKVLLDSKGPPWCHWSDILDQYAKRAEKLEKENAELRAKILDQSR